MKHYIRALLDYEKNNSSFDLLCNFIALRKHDLLNSYCDGTINLPSFILLKKLKEKYSYLCCSDDELDSLFESAIGCSKVFYSQTLKIISVESNKFENLFSQQAQPIGQQLINLLINIKLKIRIIRLHRKSLKRSGILRILQNISIYTKPFRIIFNKILRNYKLLDCS